jgi:hypothetical protein
MRGRVYAVAVQEFFYASHQINLLVNIEHCKECLLCYDEYIDAKSNKIVNLFCLEKIQINEKNRTEKKKEKREESIYFRDFV